MTSKEQVILEAAKKVFFKKGYDGTTMLYIAKEANINKTMLYYYYRSKDNLFNIIFDEVLKKFYENIAPILSNSDLDVFTKINNMVDEHISFFIQNPGLSAFIASEYIRNPKSTAKQMNAIINASESFQFFSEQIQKEYKKDIIRQIDVYALISNTLSLCSFLIITQSTILNITGELSNYSHPFPEPYKKEITDLIINIIKPSEKQDDI